MNSWFKTILCITCLLLAGPAFAQEEELTPEQKAAMEQAMEKSFEEEITVTGSLIPRPTTEAFSPVATVEPEEITYSGVTRIEDLVAQMPQVFAAQNATVANGASGTATVALRNLGTVRTLVLINGRRMAPGNAEFQTAPDLNFIPSAMVKRVDVLTGGASSVYGADAVAGVVNFILDTDFTGVRGGINFAGFHHNNNNKMAQQMNEDAGFPYPSGSTFDGQAYDVNIAVGGKFADGKGHASAYIDYRNVDALLKSERDYTNCSPGMGTTGPVCSGSSTTPRGRFISSDADFTGGVGGDYVLTLAEEGGDGHSFRPRTGEVFNYGPFNYMQRPDQRWVAGGFANYEINDHFDVYAEIMMMDDYSEAQIAPTGNFGRTTVINCDNPMLSAQQRDLVCTSLGYAPTDLANLTILRRNLEGNPRMDTLRHTTYRLVGGMRGDINDYWSYDVYGLWADMSSPQVYINDFASNRILESLLIYGDPEDPDTWECAPGASAGCVPWNIFQEGGVTQEAIDFLEIDAVMVSGAKTVVANGTLFGDLEGWGLTIPSASEALQVAVGAEYREESLFVRPDDARANGLIAGFGGATVPVEGKYDVSEVFVEALVPIVQDARGFRDLSLELGYRYSDYSTSGGTNNYKAQIAWSPTDSWKFRAGTNRATRAPNINELFSPAGFGLGGSVDICAGPSPGFTAAQCANTGVTAGQYGFVLPNPAGQYNTYGGGNPFLDPEVADTITAGIVWTPQSIPGLSITVDYYDIQIEDTIGSLNADDIIQQCALTGDPTLCDLIHRDQAGTLWLTEAGYTETNNQNIGQLYAEGVDLNYAWLIGLGNSGYLNTSLIGSYMMANRIANPLIDYDCVGFYGNQCGIPNSKWRHRARFSWETNFNWVFTLGWRYIGSVLVDDASSNPQIGNPDAIEGPGGHKVNGSYENPAFNYIDLAVSVNFAKHLQWVLGVNNIFDEEPPLGPDMNGNDYGPGWYGYYDPWGRYVHTSLQFNF
jgi:outer membrane receptor protein involved in Fe transport